MTPFIVVYRLLGLVVATLIAVPSVVICDVVPGLSPHSAIRFWHRNVCRFLGVTVVARGEPLANEGGLIVPNHISYLDIPAIGSLKALRFVAKAEVATTPVIGFVARCGGTVFIERRPSLVRAQRKMLHELLESGEQFVVFPEGTATDGRHILPFKTSLFQAVLDVHEDARLHVQPVTVDFTSTHKGEPLSDALHDLYTWGDDRSLPRHLWQVLSEPGVIMTVIFHDPVYAGDFDCRKSLALYCEEVVRRGLEDMQASEAA